MIFTGETLFVEKTEDGIARLVLDRKNESVNKFDCLTVGEFSAALDSLQAEPDISGLLISSAKSVFVVGADISEFPPLFTQPDEQIGDFLRPHSDNLRRLESLDYPVVVAINGFALGGGLELCLACDYRLASELAVVGLPETSLGLIPGWGGTARLPRLTGANTALQWVSSGAQQKAGSARQCGVLDEVVPAENLIVKAEAVLRECQQGARDYREVRRNKEATSKHWLSESKTQAGEWKEKIASRYGEHYPAQRLACQSVLEGLDQPLDEALAIERRCFTVAAKTDQAAALVGNFLSDQYLMKCAKGRAKTVTQAVGKAGVLGAGIMGGGIAYQSALTGTATIMKDIAQQGLDLGMAEADALLSKRVSKGRMSEQQKAAVLAIISPTLDYGADFTQVEILVEAVVENTKVKHAVLSELENHLQPSAIICSNTSTIPITELATALTHPERFCGMHFFNPVHAMPLVEVIRGEKTSEQTINQTVAYALSMKKKPVVVNDCSGFFVNRLLFAYYAGFARLLADGADYEQVDKAMEQWGWPMGPAYLADVIGLDTMQHCDAVITEAYAERFKVDCASWYQTIVAMGGLGQKNGSGFYRYDKVDGKPVKHCNDAVKAKIQSLASPAREFTDEQIVERMMVPMAIEMAHALESEIVASPAEGDIALLYGVGFPAFRGGLARWMDTIGLKALCAMAEKYVDELGALYQVTAGQRQMADSGERYYD